MNEVRFGRWPEVLAQASLPQRQKASWAITLRWYLNFCRRGRAAVTVQSARDFVEWAQQEKHPEPWQLESWKEALNWFFREGKEPVVKAPHREPLPIPPQTTAGGGEGEKIPVWKTDYLRALRRGHYAYRTEGSYLVWLERFARFCGGDDLQKRGPEDIKAYLDELAMNEHLSASSQKQALNAVVFLLHKVYGKDLGDFSDYRRAKVRPHAPTWLTAREMTRLLEELEPRWRLPASVAFGGGLRLMELLRLRVKDVDLEEKIITVRAGKGGKDRLVPLAEVMVEPLGHHLEQVRRCYDQDRRDGVAGVWLSEGLERKYPKAGQEWPWFWLWPEDHLSRDPRSGLQRRHHLQDWDFQRRIKEAGKKAGLNKRVTPHVLRHSFATQMVDDKCDIRTLQELLGHKSVETTMIYTHVMKRPGLGIKSPMDNL